MIIQLFLHFETAWFFFTLEIAFKRRKQANIYIFFCFCALKKSEQAEIVAFNRLVNYNIHFLFYWREDQRTRVDSCDTEKKNMEWKNE